MDRIRLGWTYTGSTKRISPAFSGCACWVGCFQIQQTLFSNGRFSSFGIIESTPVSAAGGCGTCSRRQFETVRRITRCSGLAALYIGDEDSRPCWMIIRFGRRHRTQVSATSDAFRLRCRSRGS